MHHLRFLQHLLGLLVISVHLLLTLLVGVYRKLELFSFALLVFFKGLLSHAVIFAFYVVLPPELDHLLLKFIDYFFAQIFSHVGFQIGVTLFILVTLELFAIVQQLLSCLFCELVFVQNAWTEKLVIPFFFEVWTVFATE